MKRIRFAAEAALFRVLLVLARVLPRRALLSLGARCGDLGYALDRRHRRIALDNLQRALPGIDPPRARRLVRECWRHFGRISLDTLGFHRFDLSAIGRTVHYEGLEHLRAAWERGKGVVVLSGHFGHWELIAMMQGHLGMPMGLIARRLDNPRLERLLARMRGLSGNHVIHKREAIRRSLRVLRDGGAVAIVIDQDARDDGVFVPFFGRLASTTPAAALLALRSGAAIVPAFSLLQDDGSYRIVYEPQIAVVSRGERNADVVRLTAELTAIVERWVRRHPEMWLWMHRRWKTPPPDPGASDA